MSDVYVQPTTLVLLFNERNEVLLGFKKRWFGQGKRNGFGGKVKQWESIVGAALRELQEESGVILDSTDLCEQWQIRFEFRHDPLRYQDMTVFVGRYDWPFRESEEMKPQWRSVHALPYNQMWEDDSVWMKDLLKGIYVRYHFVFDGDNRVIATYEL